MQRRRGVIGRQSQRSWIVFALVSLVAFWSICFLILASEWNGSDPVRQTKSVDSPINTGDSGSLRNMEETLLKPQNLSRSGSVVAIADVRGNLGPASVVVQTHPGKDWIHDRWQAASDMHGTAIRGAHWILLDFGREIVPEKVILDWEAAYSDKYRLEASVKHITDESPSSEIWQVFDSTDPTQKEFMSVEHAGQSPGVKSKTSLHIIHTLDPLQSRKPLRYLRLYILKSAMGWGVSLWQFDVIGYYKDDVTK